MRKGYYHVVHFTETIILEKFFSNVKCWISKIIRAGALAQWLKLPAWKFGDQVSKNQNVKIGY